MLLSWEGKDAIESEIRIRNVLVWYDNGVYSFNISVHFI